MEFVLDLSKSESENFQGIIGDAVCFRKTSEDGIPVIEVKRRNGDSVIIAFADEDDRDDEQDDLVDQVNRQIKHLRR